MTRRPSPWLLLLGLLACGCAAAAAAPTASSAAPAARVADPIFAPKGALSSAVPMFRGPRDETAPIAFTPQGLSFAAARGREEAIATLELRNQSDRTLEVRTIELDASGAPFRLRDLPPLPARVPARASLRLTAAFVPDAQTPLGVYHAQVRAGTERGPAVVPSAALAGLLFASPVTSEDEPPLQAVVEALGLGVKVGGPQAVLGSSPAPIGDEVAAPLFERAQPGPVTVLPLACFAVKGLSYGYYLPGAPSSPIAPLRLATFVVGQNKHLRPRLEAPATTTLEVADGQPFGVWLQGANRDYRFFTEDARNPETQHRARVYPLRWADGSTAPHAFLIAFENWVNWDYQDAVFVLWNAKPARR